MVYRQRSGHTSKQMVVSESNPQINKQIINSLPDTISIDHLGTQKYDKWNSRNNMSRVSNTSTFGSQDDRHKQLVDEYYKVEDTFRQKYEFNQIRSKVQQKKQYLNTQKNKIDKLVQYQDIDKESVQGLEHQSSQIKDQINEFIQFQEIEQFYGQIYSNVKDRCYQEVQKYKVIENRVKTEISEIDKSLVQVVKKMSQQQDQYKYLYQELLKQFTSHQKYQKEIEKINKQKQSEISQKMLDIQCNQIFQFSLQPTSKAAKRLSVHYPQLQPLFNVTKRRSVKSTKPKFNDILKKQKTQKEFINKVGYNQQNKNDYMILVQEMETIQQLIQQKQKDIDQLKLQQNQLINQNRDLEIQELDAELKQLKKQNMKMSDSNDKQQLLLITLKDFYKKVGQLLEQVVQIPIKPDKALVYLEKLVTQFDF